MGWVVGIDIGGTFTDLYAHRVGSDEELLLKVPSVPSNPAKGVMDALRSAADQRGLDLRGFLAEVEVIGHASTISTNLVVERKGSCTGLLVTAGFPDSLALQRLNLGRLTFDLGFQRPEALVPRRLVREVPERVDRKGRVVQTLDEEAVLAAVAELAEAGVEAIAVAYLWSFRNPEHERRTGELIAERFPDMWVSLSHKVVPLLGEYERTCTTVIDAYIGRQVSTYLHNLNRELAEAGNDHPVVVMQTLGGTSPIKHVADRPVRTLNSGPVAGAAAAAAIGRELGLSNVIAGDVGGTSFDVSLVVDAAPVKTQGATVLGFHTLISTVDVHAVGAGGGSIAQAIGERLQVGPESAGAEPGPASYGRGGRLATVTDALVTLGIVDADKGLASGSFPLRSDLAQEAIGALAGELGIKPLEAALSVYDVVNANMADAIRVSSVRRGHDPRSFAFLMFGGAGPAHAWAIAEELEIPEVVIPTAGSVLSAYGLVSAEMVFEEVLSRRMQTPLDGEEIVAELFRLAERARAAAEQAGSPASEMRFSLDARYVGQLNDLSVEIPGDWLRSPESLEANLRAAFDETYERVFGAGSQFEDAPLMLTRFRVELVGRAEGRERPARHEEAHDAEPSGRRVVSLSRRHQGLECEVFHWPDLRPGTQVEGPALIESPLTTCVVGPGQRAWLDGFNNIRIDVRSRGGLDAASS